MDGKQTYRRKKMENEKLENIKKAESKLRGKKEIKIKFLYKVAEECKMEVKDALEIYNRVWNEVTQ